ncbi:heptaprenyl diphosphate synthase, partial [Staphylococcus saprophyticus]|nr:heptaprenyl diphosphate synthase [Staphylococcus saprophyticus]
KQQIQQLNSETDHETFVKLIDQIRNSDVIAQSQAVSDKYLNKALHLIDELDNEDSKSLFKKLIKKVGKRNV